jgi:hypothetical protein
MMKAIATMIAIIEYLMVSAELSSIVRTELVGVMKLILEVLLGETKVLLPGTTPLVAKLLTVAVAA